MRKRRTGLVRRKNGEEGLESKRSFTLTENKKKKKKNSS